MDNNNSSCRDTIIKLNINNGFDYTNYNKVWINNISKRLSQSNDDNEKDKVNFIINKKIKVNDNYLKQKESLKLITNLLNNVYINDFNYKIDGCYPIDIYYDTIGKKALISFYLNHYHGGRVGFIHGGSSFSICFISFTILIQLIITSIRNIKSQEEHNLFDYYNTPGLFNYDSYSVKYLRKLNVNSYCYVDVYYQVLDSNIDKIDEKIYINKAIIVCEVKNHLEETCVVTKFQLSDNITRILNNNDLCKINAKF